jgi:glycosyltransferase involved in cell wall biosynthesis
MPDRICFVYAWATCGGVERVFLNRSEALLRRSPDLEIEVYFYEDAGGVLLFDRYLKARGLARKVRVTDTFKPSRYDAIFAVDTPQLVVDYPSVRNRAFMECHTPYAGHRAYLREWQNWLERLIVPSQTFGRVVEDECPGLRGKLLVLRNFVPRLPECAPRMSLPEWTGPVFLYFSRIDDNKNFGEFVAGISSAAGHFGREPLGIGCGPVIPGYPLSQVLERGNARGSVIMLPPIPFENGHVLFRSLRERRAVFVAPSKGESFGLSAAEAMTAGLPVVLSDIPPHRALVSGRKKFVYPLGNVRDLAGKMAAAVQNYDEYSAECLDLSAAFSERAFLEDWDFVLGKHGEMADQKLARVGADR